VTERKPIREYLDDPSLLRKLSLEDLENWANEVSYPAIIYQLMAMKVVQEEPSPSSKHVIRNALASSPNPNKLSRDLYEIALTYEKEKDEIIVEDTQEVSDTAAMPENEIPDIHQAQSDADLPEASEEQRTTEKETSTDSEVDAGSSDDEALTSFSEWLLSLERSRVEEPEVNNDDGIISEALASLLVQQGHNEKALSMYERLTLKYPEKSTYFAAQIENLRGS
jgi:hypothetical protein